MINPNEIQLLDGAFTASLDENGKWIYKSNPVPFKANGVLKKEYHDLPRYKVIAQLENTFKQSFFDDVLRTSVIEITKQLKSFE